nr:Unknown Function [uncultured bacterium]
MPSFDGEAPEQSSACSKFLAIEAFKVGKSISEILNADLNTPRKNIRSRADLASFLVAGVNREIIDPEDPVVIDFRNHLVIKALKIALDSGQAPNFTVVYGGAHMQGIEKGILDMGYTPESETWLTAFSFAERDEL